MSGIRADELERIAAEETRRNVLSDASIELLIKNIKQLQETANDPLERKERVVAEIDRKINNLVAALASGGSEAISAKIRQLEREKSDLKLEIAKERILSTPLTEEMIRSWLVRFREADIESETAMRQMFKTFISQINVLSDRIEIIYNLSEGNKNSTSASSRKVLSVDFWERNTNPAIYGSSLVFWFPRCLLQTG